MSSKNIVLCSDGTGQAGGQGFVSNVWRVFKAVDRHHDEIEQVAFHADGVGSEQNKTRRAIGGAFGWGLSQDIMTLYASLVRSYKPGDKIFLFGFSRGGFTVRSLAGMIHEVGILKNDFSDNSTLQQAVRQAYRAYRKKGETPAIDTATCHVARIHFVGVWDTVDAIGVPIDEMRDAIYAVAHRWFAPHNVALTPSIDHACHAMSIDDERHTFHPMIWNEKTSGFTGTVKQVWFTGVHSNVGGGYPKDSLAFISLDWMMKQAHDCGLRFLQSKWNPYPEATETRRFDDTKKKKFGEYQDQADRNGRIYDSRSGLASYYRYQPRNIAKLWRKDHGGETDIGLPTIHESVLLRISSRNTGYVPTAINGKFLATPTWSSDFRPDTGEPLQPEPWECEGPDLAGAWRCIGTARLLYFAQLLATILFIAVGIVMDDGGIPCEGTGFCASSLAIFQGMVPDFAAGWLAAYWANPGWLIGLIVTLYVLHKLRGWIANEINRAASAAWKQVNLATRQDSETAPEAHP